MTAFEYIEQECKKLGDEADAARARLFELLDSEHTRAEFEEAKEKYIAAYSKRHAVAMLSVDLQIKGLI